MNIVLIGNPNCGLTTLFNQMTGGLHHTGLFSTSSNITKEGNVKRHSGVLVTELPGIYSLSPYSIDDVSTREILLHGKPDVIINIVDALSIERNLYLTLQLLELELPMVVALNMMDEVKNNKIHIDIPKLQEKLTVPVMPISASRNDGIHDLIHCAIETAKDKQTPQSIDFCDGYTHTAIHTVENLIADYARTKALPLRFCSTKVVEGDTLTIKELGIEDPELDIINHIVDDMEYHLSTDREAAMADMRYSFIEKVCAKVISRPEFEPKEYLRSIKIDKLLTHRIFAIPIFLCIMFMIFFFTFGSIGAFLSDLLSICIDFVVGSIDSGLTAVNINPAVHSLVIDGICAGVGSVLSFMPIVAVLFLFLSILEDSGYMPRVAFVMDKLLRKLGLSGRSIVPMLIGFGCSVPAILAARSLPSKRDRFLTMALVPFMSCSAKLPIYAMFIAAFFASYQTLAIMGIYITGILVAVICALIFNKTAFKGNPVPFVMVLPPYRIPAAKGVFLKTWENTKDFLKKVFTIIFLATIVIWFLQSFDTGFNMVTSSETSMLADLGKFVAPIFEPLGFGDWRASTALITGLSAKEAVVSTLAVLIGSGADSAAITATLATMFTPLSAFAFLAFCLLYMPCMATLATIRREMGSWKYALGTVIFQTTVAWIVAFLIYNIGSMIL